MSEQPVRVGPQPETQVERQTFDVLYQELREGVAWVYDIVGQRDTRLDRYIEALGFLAENRHNPETIKRAQEAQGSDCFYNPVYEANELIHIWKVFSASPIDGLRPRLVELVTGPPSYRDERAGSSGRDFGFELYIASLFHSAGIQVDISRASGADIIARLEPYTMIVECKRPRGYAGVKECIKKARRQIRETVADLTNGDTRNLVRVVAFSLNKVINPDFHTVVADASENVEELLRSKALEFYGSAGLRTRLQNNENDLDAIWSHFALPIMLPEHHGVATAFDKRFVLLDRSSRFYTDPLRARLAHFIDKLNEVL